jgi:hypothetical protein
MNEEEIKSNGFNLLEPVFKFASADFYGPTIMLVGCGGTGGYVAGHLARLATIHQMALIFVDGDTVEQKNLQRQHFINADIGKNKAVALAERYNGAFGLNITAYPEFIEDSNKIQRLIYNSSRENLNRSPMPAILIGCVDSDAARVKFHEWFCGKYYQNFGNIWIDSGNEETSGQVSLGFRRERFDSYNTISYKSLSKDAGYYSKGNFLFNLPSIIDKHPEILNWHLNKAVLKEQYLLRKTL